MRLVLAAALPFRVAVAAVLYHPAVAFPSSLAALYFLHLIHAGRVRVQLPESFTAAAVSAAADTAWVAADSALAVVAAAAAEVASRGVAALGAAATAAVGAAAAAAVQAGEVAARVTDDKVKSPIR